MPESGHQRRIFIFHKPDGVLSQFRPVEGKKTLADYGPFPKDVHPVGRLDEDSEGLLLLTNDGVLHQRLIDPAAGHPRTYLVQVERLPDAEALAGLAGGVIIGGSRTRPAEVRLLEEDPPVGPRTTPIRFRKNVPTAWLEITVREGRNRQVRKMTAAVGHPTLRLIRTSVGVLSIGDLGPGEARSLSPEEAARLRASVGLAGRSGAPQARDVRHGKKSMTTGGRNSGGGAAAPWSRRGAGGTRNTRGTRGRGRSR